MARGCAGLVLVLAVLCQTSQLYALDSDPGNGAAAEQRIVSSLPAFRAALEEPSIISIVLNSTIILDEAWGPSVDVRRHVDVRASAELLEKQRFATLVLGNQAPSQASPLLSLGPGVTVTFTGVDVLTSGNPLDEPLVPYFAACDGGRLVFRGCLLHRVSGLPYEAALARLASVPQPNGDQQGVSLAGGGDGADPLTLSTTARPGPLWVTQFLRLTDYVVALGPQGSTLASSNGAQPGGCAVEVHDSLYITDHAIPSACLATRPADECLAQLNADIASGRELDTFAAGSLLALSPFDDGLPGSRLVTSPEQLHDAMADPGVIQILVGSTIAICNGSAWGDTVEVTRNVTIRPTRALLLAQKYATIDFGTQNMLFSMPRGVGMTFIGIDALTRHVTLGPWFRPLRMCDRCGLRFLACLVHRVVGTPYPAEVVASLDYPRFPEDGRRQSLALSARPRFVDTTALGPTLLTQYVLLYDWSGAIPQDTTMVAQGLRFGGYVGSVAACVYMMDYIVSGQCLATTPGIECMTLAAQASESGAVCRPASGVLSLAPFDDFPVPTSRLVSTAAELRDALTSVNVSDIVVNASIVIPSGDNWGGEVAVARNVTVRATRELLEQQLYVTIDLGPQTRVISLTGGASLTLIGIHAKTCHAVTGDAAFVPLGRCDGDCSLTFVSCVLHGAAGLPYKAMAAGDLQAARAGGGDDDGGHGGHGGGDDGGLARAVQHVDTRISLRTTSAVLQSAGCVNMTEYRVLVPYDSSPGTRERRRGGYTMAMYDSLVIVDYPVPETCLHAHSAAECLQRTLSDAIAGRGPAATVWVTDPSAVAPSPSRTNAAAVVVPAVVVPAVVFLAALSAFAVWRRHSRDSAASASAAEAERNKLQASRGGGGSGGKDSPSDTTSHIACPPGDGGGSGADADRTGAEPDRTGSDRTGPDRTGGATRRTDLFMSLGQARGLHHAGTGGLFLGVEREGGQAPEWRLDAHHERDEVDEDAGLRPPPDIHLLPSALPAALSLALTGLHADTDGAPLRMHTSRTGHTAYTASSCLDSLLSPPAAARAGAGPGAATAAADFSGAYDSEYGSGSCTTGGLLTQMPPCAVPGEGIGGGTGGARSGGGVALQAAGGGAGRGAGSGGVAAPSKDGLRNAAVLAGCTAAAVATVAVNAGARAGGGSCPDSCGTSGPAGGDPGTASPPSSLHAAAASGALRAPQPRRGPGPSAGTPHGGPSITMVCSASTLSYEKRDQHGAGTAACRTAAPCAGDVFEELGQLAQEIRSSVRDVVIRLEGVLGCGNFGTVYKGTWQGLPVAVKAVAFSAGADSRRRAMQEAALCQSITHPNVIATYAAELQPLGGPCVGLEGPGADPGVCMDWRLLIIQEFADGGPLMGLYGNPALWPAPGEVDLAAVLPLALGLARALAHLHAKRIVHGDLNPNNVLLRRDHAAPSGFTAKVADFGLSLVLPEGRSHVSNLRMGTVFYICPAVAVKGHVGQAADIFSLGVILWELYHGRRAGINTKEGPRYCTNFPAFPPSCPEPFRDLAWRCLQRLPAARCAAAEVVAALEAMISGSVDPEQIQTQIEIQIQAQAQTAPMLAMRGGTASLDVEPHGSCV
ncbi:hypothetical protein HYH03_011901 [Edaphochlamys debaryana]|uniref:Protein kinase domain-containing protein n=1 Tax=Edaphochlamys debaryana TaxID=47281 RepID=A0A835XWG5_9CHLO|nr:hypothetical protein HYH03_011901 [Edaphochlamys debaryana]|eukprot:KAG2489621.1 hypothetical protein HYH03_011901 [Edaphochlamys debaryana]